MNGKLLLLDSLTAAYRARDFLYRHGYSTTVERIPANLRKSGCSYGVHVFHHVEEAVVMLEKSGFHVRDQIEI